jgi:hypothetical protein
MNDIDILNEEKKEYIIGPKRKKVKLEMLGISKYYQVFIPRFLIFLEFFKKDNELLSLPSMKDWNKKKKVDASRSQLQRLFSHTNVQHSFFRLLKKAGYIKFSKRYFFEYVKPTEMVDMFIKIYKFNVDDFKKKVSEMELEVLITGHQSQTSIENYLKKATSSHTKNGTGKKGRLKPRFQQLKVLTSPS